MGDRAADCGLAERSLFQRCGIKAAVINVALAKRVPEGLCGGDKFLEHADCPLI